MLRKHDVVRLRTRLSLSQEKFAQKLGVSVWTVSNWERGLSKPRGLSLRALERIAKPSRRRTVKG
ncbi:MAG: helix-turn-helix domain-containing protein [Deltaproteobacteria bacterium]|nr:helix-turn-helix domain-containing protein [Deltaproteobacteria bacterium]